MEAMYLYIFKTLTLAFRLNYWNWN